MLGSNIACHVADDDYCSLDNINLDEYGHLDLMNNSQFLEQIIDLASMNNESRGGFGQQQQNITDEAAAAVSVPIRITTEQMPVVPPSPPVSFTSSLTPSFSGFFSNNKNNTIQTHSQNDGSFDSSNASYYNYNSMPRSEGSSSSNSGRDDEDVDEEESESGSEGEVEEEKEMLVISKPKMAVGNRGKAPKKIIPSLTTTTTAKSGFIRKSSKKPPMPYADIIVKAILSSRRENQIQLKDIYQYMIENFEFFSSQVDSKKWRNSVRHNLSCHKYFQKTSNKNSQGYFWSIHPSYVKLLKNGDFSPKDMKKLKILRSTSARNDEKKMMKNNFRQQKDQALRSSSTTASAKPSASASARASASASVIEHLPLKASSAANSAYSSPQIMPVVRPLTINTTTNHSNWPPSSYSSYSSYSSPAPPVMTAANNNNNNNNNNSIITKNNPSYNDSAYLSSSNDSVDYFNYHDFYNNSSSSSNNSNNTPNLNLSNNSSSSNYKFLVHKSSVQSSPSLSDSKFAPVTSSSMSPASASYYSNWRPGYLVQS